MIKVHCQHCVCIPGGVYIRTRFNVYFMNLLGTNLRPQNLNILLLKMLAYKY